MAHAAAHIKKARSEMDQPPDLKALEKARERRRRSRERAERKRKSSHFQSSLHRLIVKVSPHLYQMETLSESIIKGCGGVGGAEIIIKDYPCPYLYYPPSPSLSSTGIQLHPLKKKV
ncbi:hypothetical protein L3Q82_017081 [Scortum barcoo]|uniref:Uncharacterized protein n=1 Tax=Scortum barcoo TaxID=214431 RepID=A0ACB8X975_9TELE|nr:hypothetical protein L3Q82_017081 [Scortum barcoo]